MKRWTRQGTTRQYLSLQKKIAILPPGFWKITTTTMVATFLNVIILHIFAPQCLFFISSSFFSVRAYTIKLTALLLLASKLHVRMIKNRYHQKWAEELTALGRCKRTSSQVFEKIIKYADMLRNYVTAVVSIMV